MLRSADAPLKTVCTQSKCKSLGIKCNTNSEGTNPAHTTVHKDSVYWHIAVQPPLYSCARGKVVHTWCSQRPTRPEACCLDIARPDKKIMIFDPSKRTGGLTGTKKGRLPSPVFRWYLSFNSHMLPLIFRRPFCSFKFLFGSPLLPPSLLHVSVQCFALFSCVVWSPLQ